MFMFRLLEKASSDFIFWLFITLFIGSIAENVSQTTVAIKLNNSAWATQLKIDTGSEANVIPKSIYKRLKLRP